MSQTSTPTRFSQVTCLRDETDQSEEAFRAFVDRSSARAMRVAWRMLGEDPGAAEDVVQDAFVAAWKALPEFRGEASLDTWFFRILVRRAQNHRRWKNIRTLWSAPPRHRPRRSQAGAQHRSPASGPDPKSPQRAFPQTTRILPARSYGRFFRKGDRGHPEPSPRNHQKPCAPGASSPSHRTQRSHKESSPLANREIRRHR